MFKAVISDVPLLKDAIETVSQIISEGVFKINKNGIELAATDRAMVAVVDLKLDAKAFEVFQIDKETTIGVNIENLIQILRRAKSTDKLELELSADESKLSIKMMGDSSRKFSMPLLDISQGELPDISKLEFTTKIQMKTPAMEEGVEDAYILSDSLIFEAGKSGLVMKTDGSSSTSETHVDQSKGMISFEGSDARARYPLEYLKKIIKAGKISPVTTINFGKDFPMKLDFKSPEKCSMTFVLAPRVEE